MAVQRRPKYQKIFGVVSQADFSKPLERDLSYWEFVASHSKKRTIGIVWNGNQHNFHFLLDTNEPFKVFNFFEDNQNSPAIPMSQIKQLFKPTFDELENTIKLFNKSKELILIGTPPPKSKQFIDQKIMSENFFLEIAKNNGLSGKQLSATSDSFRTAMWKITQTMTNEIAIRHGHKFIPIPSTAIDENGLLVSDYWTEDVSHANEDFGALMMDAILNSMGFNSES